MAVSSHGCRGALHDRFVEALSRRQPSALAAVEAERAAERKRAADAARLAALFKATQTGEPAGSVLAAAALTSKDKTVELAAERVTEQRMLDSAVPDAPGASGVAFAFGFKLP
jgi:hypothetical protein